MGYPFHSERGDQMGENEKSKEEKEKLKYEIAEELGLLDKVKDGGWKSLTSKETGRIGGIMTKRLKNKG